MHLVVTVKCGARESRFRVPVGNGQKTFKWLGLVAASRYGAESPRGKLRQRESRQAQPAGTALVPRSITTERCDFFHPEALLAEQLGDGEHVTVEVAPRVAVDAAGAPRSSRWQTIAFAVSPSRKARRDGALADEYDAQAARRTAAVALAADQRRSTNARKAVDIRRVVGCQLPDRDTVHEALHEDWFAMAKNRVLEALVPAPAEQHRVKDVLLAHYVQLDELFKTYAASGSSLADSQELELSEFDDFCQNAGIIAQGPHMVAIVTSCYQEANGDFSHAHRKAGKGGGAAGGRRSTSASLYETKHIGRPEFFNALIWFALFWACHPDGQPDHGGGAAGRPAWCDEFSRVRHAGRQLAALIDERIVPLIHKRLPGALGKMALGSDDVLALLHDHEAELRSIFGRRARTADDEITVTEFVGICDDAGLIGRGGPASPGAEGDDAAAPPPPGAGGANLSLKDVRQAFAASQSEIAFAPPDSKKRPKKGAAPAEGRDLHAAHALMSFPEFLEAICRVGLIKWSAGSGPDKQSLADRVERSIRAVVALKGRK